MSARPALSPAAARVYDNINAATSPDMLDNLARGVWHQYSKGAFTGDEATFLTGAVDRRRPITFDRLSRALGAYKPIGTLLPRIGSKFAPRPCRKRLSDVNGLSAGTGNGCSVARAFCPTPCATTTRRASAPSCGSWPAR
jgi:hypothetical protein